MGELARLPNIGRVNEEKLLDAGIDSPGRLRELGSRKAIELVRGTSDPGACLGMLYALEGAIRGVRWHDLPAEVKDELRAFHRTLR